MTVLMHILAETDPTVKIVIAVAIFGLWALSQVVSSIGKKKDKTRPPELDYPMNAPPETPMPPPRPVPPSQRQAPPRQPQQPVRRQPNTRVDTKQRQRAEKNEAQRRKEQARQQAEAQLRAMQQPSRDPTPPPLVRRPPAAPASSDVPARVDNLTDPALRRKAAGPNRAQRLAAILRPGNLQKEFLVTEVLQPPLALRPPPRDLP